MSDAAARRGHQKEVSQLQSEADAAMKSVSENTLLLGQVLMAVSNLLQRCVARRGGQPVVLKHTETPHEVRGGALPARPC